MEYKITASETSVQTGHISRNGYTGLLIQIEPPVPYLNPEAVERFLVSNGLRPLDEAGYVSHPDNDVNDVILLGSSHERTTIYARLRSRGEEHMSGVTEDLKGQTAVLLGLMGLKATIA
jgi:hypothetical protein